MKTISLEVEDNNLDTLLTIIKNLKDGIVKNLKVDNSIGFVSESEQNYYENLLNNMSNEDKTISSKELCKI
ncbi:MAG: hypothetical protein ABGW74_03100 [Campylobacterales bacterium]